MSFKGLILQEKQGKRIDKDFLASAAKIYSTGYGVSVVIDGVLTTKGTIPEDGNSAEDLAEVIEAFEEDQVNLFIFECDDEPKEDDLQPYALFFEDEEKTVPILSVFITGELKKYNDDSGYSPQHQFAYEFLQGAIDELLQKSSATDEDEVIDEINTNKDFQQKIFAEAGEDIKIVFHSRGDNMATLAVDGKGDRAFDWGWASDGVETPKKKLGGGKGKSSVGSDSTLIPAKRPTESAPRQIKYDFPADMSNNEKRDTVHRALGKLPSGWKDMKSMMVDYERAKEMDLITVKTFEEMKKRIDAEKASKAASDKQAPQPAMPLVSAEDKKKTDTFIDAMDPGTWKTEELKVSDWTSQTGHHIFSDKPEDKPVSKWPFEELLRYHREVPYGAACLCFELMKRLTGAQLIVDAAKKNAAEPPKKKTLGGKKSAA